MKGDITLKVFLRDLIIIMLVSFALQYTWEFSQSNIFYIRTLYSPSILRATVGDVIITLVLYVILLPLTLIISKLIIRKLAN